MSALVFTLIVTQITIASVTLYLHRSMAHKSVVFNNTLNHFFRFWLWLTTGMVTKEWVAIHRKHHAKCETEEDPHSPIHKGIKKVFFQGAFLYKKASKDKESIEFYGKETPNDWIENNLYSKYQTLGLTIMLAIDLFLFGYTGFLVWIVQMIWIPLWAAGVINGLGHYIGYRSFSTPDTSTNLIPIGFYIGGEELHNNHHAFPRSAKFSLRAGEFDIGWLYIKVLSFFGLAKVLERAPQLGRESSKFVFGSAANLFSNKMRSVRNYENQVISKILDQEIKNVKLDDISFATLSNYMIKPKFLNISDEISNKISNLINSNKSLDTVYNLKIKLEQAWQGVGISVQDRVEMIKDWCKEARQAKIAQLESFAEYLERKFAI
jgi:stearoyl-CoA desaturase (delta-9 desaturase)